MMKKLLFILFAVMSIASIYAAEEATAPADMTPMEFVWRSGKHFYQGDQLLTKHEYISLLKTTSPKAFRHYQKGRRLMQAGWSIFGIGAASFAMGSVMFIVDAATNGDCGMGPSFAASLINMPITGACLAVSIPMLCVGYKERDRSMATYNMFCQGEPPITYNITVGQNGIGFAINF